MTYVQLVSHTNASVTAKICHDHFLSHYFHFFIRNIPFLLFLIRYCEIFAESRGTLLDNITTNASRRQHNNRGIPKSGVFYAVRRQANSNATMEHVTHMNKATARSVFRVVRPEAV
jgi:hypothetical protein